MPEYIEREEALKHKRKMSGADFGGEFWDEAVLCEDIRNIPAADVVEIPNGGIGNLSDGYHTFNELYHHRAILFAVICNSNPTKAWKSKLHDTGDMFDGMFIVGIETPQGQATYHYDIEPYWDLFKVKELEKAPKWDGHTPQQAIDRISLIAADVVSNTVFQQVKWERDIAFKTLEEHGIGFAQKTNVVEVKHGEWITGKKEKLYYNYDMSGFYDYPVKCSVCKFDLTEYGYCETDYCPNCGTKMDGKGD